MTKIIATLIGLCLFIITISYAVLPWHAGTVYTNAGVGPDYGPVIVWLSIVLVFLALFEPILKFFRERS